MKIDENRTPPLRKKNVIQRITSWQQLLPEDCHWLLFGGDGLVNPDRGRNLVKGLRHPNVQQFLFKLWFSDPDNDFKRPFFFWDILNHRDKKKPGETDLQYLQDCDYLTASELFYLKNKNVIDEVKKTKK